MTRALVWWLLLVSSAVAQTTLPRLGLEIPSPGQTGWGPILNNNFTYLDGHACTDTACKRTLSTNVVVEGVTAADDNYEFMASIGTTTLVSVGCICAVNCSTPAQLRFYTGGAAEITIAGLGTLTCNSATVIGSYTLFNTGDTDRVLTLGQLAAFSVVNTPTAGQRILFTVRYSVE